MCDIKIRVGTTEAGRVIIELDGVREVDGTVCLKLDQTEALGLIAMLRRAVNQSRTIEHAAAAMIAQIDGGEDRG